MDGVFARVLARLLWRFPTKTPLHHAQSKPNSKTDPSNRISTSKYPLNRAHNPERLLWRPRHRQLQPAARPPAKIFTRSRQAARVTEHERPNGHRGRLPDGNSLYSPLPNPGPVSRKPDLVLNPPAGIPLPGPGERTECRPVPIKVHRSDEEVPRGGRSIRNIIGRENREQTRPRPGNPGNPGHAETGPCRKRHPSTLDVTPYKPGDHPERTSGESPTRQRPRPAHQPSSTPQRTPAEPLGEGTPKTKQTDPENHHVQEPGEPNCRKRNWKQKQNGTSPDPPAIVRRSRPATAPATPKRIHPSPKQEQEESKPETLETTIRPERPEGHPPNPPRHTTCHGRPVYLAIPLPGKQSSPPLPAGLDYCFVRCHTTLKNNLVLQTSLKTCGTDYQPYLEAIKTAFEEEEKLRMTSIDGEARWSKFILHGVPLAASMEDVAMSIQQSYPGILKLAQTPRWLTTETKRQNSSKGMSSVVLAVAGQHTLQSLGYQYLYICNSRCRLAKYLPFGPASQCGKCFRFGHPTAMCRDENPTCGVCGKSHLTRHHTCPAADCKQGGRCTHTPTHCVNCENNLHTSIDPQCPVEAKARQQGQNTDTTMKYDTTVDTEPVPPPNHTQDC